MRVKNSKGITLVALIITIVVLLILAVVAIGSIQENGLIEKSNGAVSKWNDAQKDEESKMNSYSDYLNMYSGSNGTTTCQHTWKGSGICEKCGYACEHNLEWTEWIYRESFGYHQRSEDCTVCGFAYVVEEFYCDDWTGDGICDYEPSHN